MYLCTFIRKNAAKIKRFRTHGPGSRQRSRTRRGARHLTCGARAFRGQPRARDSDGSVLARWRERSAPGGGTSPTRSVPEMLGRRRTQAGVIIRTDSQRNVSRGNRVGWAIFRGQASHPIFEIFCHPWAIRMGSNSGKHRPVRIGSPAPRSGATIPGGGKPGPWPIPALPGPPDHYSRLDKMPCMVGDAGCDKAGAGGR